jgi:uncharacterized protein
MRKRLTIYLALTLVLCLAISSCFRRAETRQEGFQVSENVQTKTESKTSLPSPSGFVNDYAQILDENNQNEIENILNELQKRAKVDFAIAVVKSTNGQSVFDYSLETAKNWRIGGENGGILLMLVIDEREWQIQIDRKLEKILSNNEVKQIGEIMVEPLRNDRYVEGIKKCVETMIEVLAKKQSFEPIKFARSEAKVQPN